MTSEQEWEDQPFTPERPPAAFEPDTTPSAAPRVWTVFVAYVAVLLGAVTVQVIAAIGLVAWHAARGEDIQQVTKDLPALLATPVTLMVLAALSQLVIGLGAIIPARLSRTPALIRLGLVTPALPGWGYPVVVLGTLFPLAVGLGLTAALAEILPPSQAVAQLYNQMTWPVAVPFILFIAFAPGFMEELFFRGYIQRRLLERWSPWTAILVCSVLFTFMHLDPHQMAAVVPLAIWLGVVAWRTGSVWPGMLCHAFINGAWNIFQIGNLLGGWPETTTIAVAVVAVIVGLACFCGSIRLMTRRPAPRGADTGSWPDHSDNDIQADAVRRD